MFVVRFEIIIVSRSELNSRFTNFRSLAKYGVHCSNLKNSRVAKCKTFQKILEIEIHSRTRFKSIDLQFIKKRSLNLISIFVICRKNAYNTGPAKERNGMAISRSQLWTGSSSLTTR